MTARSWFTRPARLGQLDGRCQADPDWFQSQEMLGGVRCVDRFAGALAGPRSHIPYVSKLGLTYLRVMPLFCSPAGNNDGGYAVSSDRQVKPAPGTLDELTKPAGELHCSPTRGVTLAGDC